LTFYVKILGSSAAIPAYGRRHTSQYLRVQNHHFLVDCGEGTQLQLMRYRVKYQRITHIFISHLHGDHYLGLVGLLSSMHLQHRTNDLYLYGPVGLKEIISTQLKYSGTDLRYKIIFRETNPEQDELIFEDEKVSITSIPLQHRIHCTGFIFREKPKSHRLIKEKLPKEISLAAIAQLKQGNDVYDENGQLQIEAKGLILPPRKSRTYAYCSDTIYDRGLIEKVKQADLLYHEATFLQEKEFWAKETFHSTTMQAATIAKDAEVQKLLIGHFSARYKDVSVFREEARQVFENTHLAIEGENFEIKD